MSPSNAALPLLPNEPRLVDPLKEQILTEQYLMPGLAELESLFFALRRQIDPLYLAEHPVKNGKPYPLGHCLEISQSVFNLLSRIDSGTLRGQAAAGYDRIKSFLQNGGSLRQVWGVLRGKYFQNAFLVGTLYVDVSNDTVLETKPKVEILPFKISGLRPVEGYGHFASIAKAYWKVQVWPNHFAPELAPFFPLLTVSEAGDIKLSDFSAYLLIRTWTRKFRSSQRFLSQPPMPKSVFDQAAAWLKDLPVTIAETPEQGRDLALQQVGICRKERWHRRPQLQAQMITLGRKVNQALCQAKTAASFSRATRTRKRNGMNILFIHQNFPGQFKFLAPALVQQGHAVVAMTMQESEEKNYQGVRLVPYAVDRRTTQGMHPWVSDFETKVIRAEACFRESLKLKAQGLVPDVIIAHHGWGESLFLKEVWPRSRLGIYCDFFYQIFGADAGFDPEFPPKDPGDVCRLRLKNLNNLMHFETADAGISPTFWQAATFPEPFRSKITVVHDGINTAVLTPNPAASLTLNHSLVLTRDNEVITFVNRNLEPYRGYQIFMRALPGILEQRPHAHVLIAGRDGVSTGGAGPDGKSTWKEVFAAEVLPLIKDADWKRVHFLGHIPYQHFIPLLQLSTVHVYLTYPFVLSRSLLEAMSIGCAIVASDTKPLHEVIKYGNNGRLVDFFDVQGITDNVVHLLSDSAERQRLGANARQFAVENYDLQRVCLPRQLSWVEQLNQVT